MNILSSNFLLFLIGRYKKWRQIQITFNVSTNLIYNHKLLYINTSSYYSYCAICRNKFNYNNYITCISRTMRFLHPIMCGTARSQTLEDPFTLKNAGYSLLYFNLDIYIIIFNIIILDLFSMRVILLFSIL